MFSKVMGGITDFQERVYSKRSITDLLNTSSTSTGLLEQINVCDFRENHWSSKQYWIEIVLQVSIAQ